MKKRSLFSFDIFISEEDKDFLESIESDVQDGKYSGWEWDAFVSIGLQMFSKMIKNGVDTETFEYLIDNVESKYPFLCSYLNENKKDIEYLQTFSQTNNFVNHTEEKYTNEISRVKAQSIKINNEINEKNIPKNLFNEF